MSASIIRSDARRLPLRDASVNLIVCSPPYFGLRSYQDGGEPLPGQIGQEPSPQEFLEALWLVMRELWRVLAPDGSCFVNLGDKRAGSGAPGTTTGLTTLQGTNQQSRTGRARNLERVGQAHRPVQGERSGSSSYSHDRSSEFGRPKSKMLLPQRFAIGCEDGVADPAGIGWIVRQELVWSKPNGMPESVQDRCRDSHEVFWHLTKQGRYYSALDELREPHAPGTAARYAAGYGDRSAMNGERPSTGYDLGGDWEINDLGALPRSVWEIPTEPLRVPEHLEVDHFAAFPSEWPRRLILGFSPPASLVLDPFGGTGTTAMCARALGRHGISSDLSADYARLARWRIFDSDGAQKVADRTARNRQQTLL